MSDLTEQIEKLDDGTIPIADLAEKLDCSQAAICHSRSAWYNQRLNAGDENERCARCDFKPSEKIPFVENTGLCLWCWLTVEGKDIKTFYESGEWQQYIDWRPQDDTTIDDITKELQERVLAKMEAEEQDVEEVAETVGCHKNTWRTFLTQDRYKVGAVTAEAALKYLGMRPTAKELAGMFNLHPRRVAMLIRGW